MPNATPRLPIIGNLRPKPGQDSYTATEPITIEQLGQVMSSPWCHSVKVFDGPTSPADCVTYNLRAELNGDVLAVTGTATGVR